ncbi:MAG: PVC-type heme-binding CxxCH protein [Pirellulales bacterium]
MLTLLLAWCASLAIDPGVLRAADANRLTYLDGGDPFYVSRAFPKLTTPQWVGEEGVEAVVILSIDDMREIEKWETYLRPILERLKKIDGRAPVSIMTNQIDPRHPHLQKWLAEGLSLEVHTYDHPCPLLQQGDLGTAKETYDRCVDLMDRVPGSRAVAFRMPCCDSMNSASPRFFAEIFNHVTAVGNFLSIDSSVSNLTTANDPELPRELVLNADASEIFRRYLPNKSFVTTIEDYPYPFVIGRLCWEFPFAVPSDWCAQQLQRPDNPQTVIDLARALDAAVVKKGVFTLLFHPHKWIKSEQIVELVDRAVARHGNKIKFLTFREAQVRIDKHLLAGQALRASDGGDNGVRLIDLDGDGFQDVLVGNDHLRRTRHWSPRAGKWIDGELPVSLVTTGAGIGRVEQGVRFGVVREGGQASMLVRNGRVEGAWHFDGHEWSAAPELLAGLELEGKPIFTSRGGRDAGVRLVDLDGDGRTELVSGAAGQQAVFAFEPGRGWKQQPFTLPGSTTIVDRNGRDAGLRLVDIDQDGRSDVLFSDDERYGAWLFDSPQAGWSKQLVAGSRDDPQALPMLARGGTDNGAWIHDRTLFVQNEDTDKLADVVDRRPLNDLLADVRFPGPKSPQQSLGVMHARPGFRVELAAAEPLVMDPVAMAWGPDGRLWVVEMGDYPRGADGDAGHGGRVRYLEDRDGDGHYDRSTVFLDNLGFPNGVLPWRKGVLVTCAPDILYAEDTDGDGQADKREVLYHGFVEANPQHRVNGLKWGLDGWIYCAHGDAVDGKIELRKTGETVNANGRDFRIRPDEGLLDPQSGVSQYGRNRDDWDNWFGNSNSRPMYQFVLADHYLRRNPHVPAADGRVDVSEQPGVAEVFPRSRTLARYNDLYAANRFTSANSTIVYRDDFFGPAFQGNAFISEPVHNLVHREVMRPEGLEFRSRRADDERDSEFLASADNWFRPAMLAEGPDGALWVADMYRQTIEHPEWIPQEVQDQIDLRAGSDMGRIYRVYPLGKTPRQIPRLDKLSTPELVAALDTANSWQRDMVQQLLVWRNEKSAIPTLSKFVGACPRPAARVQALWTLELLGGLTPQLIERALKDEHPGVRRHGVRLAENHLRESPQLGDAILALTDDADPQVRLQRAYTLGEWNDLRAGQALGELATRFADDPFLVAAVLSSVSKENLHAVLGTVLASLEQQGMKSEEVRARPELLEQLVGLASALDDDRTLGLALARIGKSHVDTYDAWQLTAVAGLLDALARREAGWEKYDTSGELARMFDFARTTVRDDKAGESDRLRAVRLLGRSESTRGDDIKSLVALLVPQSSGALQTAAVEALARIDDPRVPQALVAGWKSHGPGLRSEILDALLSRDAWAETLLSAIEQGTVPAADVDATRRQRFSQSENNAIKERAARLLAGAIESNRQQVLAQHEPVLTMQGDAAAGATVFNKRCGVCHRLRGAGHDVGPNLASLTDYSPQVLLTAMLDPNRAVEAKYLDYQALTTGGQVFTGILVNETGNSVTLSGQEGKQQTILRTDLEVLQATGKSLMPEGIEKDITPQDMANVIAYLRGSGAPRKTFYANHPELLKPTTDGTLQLYPTTCEIYGPSIVMERLFKNLGEWGSENDRVVWNVELPKAGRYDVVLNYASPAEDAGNRWLLEAGDQSLTGEVAATGSKDRYQEVPVGQIQLSAGTQQVVLRSAGPIKGKLMQLGGVLLRPVAAAR